MTGLLALAAIALPGFALANSALPSRYLRWALAPLLGAGVWSAAYTAALFSFGAGGVVRTAKDGVLAAAGAAWLLAQRKRGHAAAATHRASTPRWLGYLFAGAAVLFAALFLEHTLRFPDGGWDAWAIWNLRARALARGGSSFRDAFSPEILFWTHQDYPLLLPGAVAQAFLLRGSQPIWIPAAIAFAFAALAAAVLLCGLAELRGWHPALLAGIALLTTPSFLGFAANQQADVPMAAYVAGAVALAMLGIETRDARPFGLCGTCASLAAWTKNEGILYAACLAGAIAVVGWSPVPRRARAVLRFGLGALPVVALLAWFKLTVAHGNDLLGNPSLRSVVDLRRWGELLGELARRVVFFQHWALWLVAEVAVLAYSAARLAAQAAPRVVAVAWACALALIGVVYLVQPHELIWFVRGSLDRVLVQLWPSILLATFLALVARSEAPTAA
jgi:hypothetical protein